MRSIGLPELFVILLIFGLVRAGFWGRIFAKAGYSRWLALTTIIPFLNLGVISWFAYSRWPVLARIPPTAADKPNK
ncbi:MAG: hypothetical protein HYX25_08375 [Candidatus Solibacter usitatus]|nr:hypothetical protein [Candidatus Solibacter usitatus]